MVRGGARQALSKQRAGVREQFAFDPALEGESREREVNVNNNLGGLRLQFSSHGKTDRAKTERVDETVPGFGKIGDFAPKILAGLGDQICHALFRFIGAQSVRDREMYLRHGANVKARFVPFQF
jgi:hypothetical protein